MVFCLGMFGKAQFLVKHISESSCDTNFYQQFEHDDPTVMHNIIVYAVTCDSLAANALTVKTVFHSIQCKKLLK